MDIKLEPTFNTAELNAKINQPQNSAFKPVIHHQNLLISSASLSSSTSSSSSSSSTSSCSSTSSNSSMKLKTNEFNLNVKSASKYIDNKNCNNNNNQPLLSSTPLPNLTTHQDPMLSQASTIASTANPMSAAVAAAALAASQLNPFYIDKIFNFQNMFLFSGANANSNNLPSQLLSSPTATTTQPFLNSNNSNESLKYFNDVLMKSATGMNQNELHTLIQQNLLHNVYNYYNNNNIPSASTSNGSASFLSRQNQQEILPININTNSDNKLEKKQSSSTKQYIKSNNFSIERILSLPSTSSNNPNEKISNNENRKTQKGSHIFKFNHHQYLPDNIAKHLGKTPIALTAPIPPSLASLYSNQATSNSTSNKINQKPIIKTENTQSSQQQQQPVYKSKNAKKYKCDLCGRGFSRSNTLITHRRIHTGEKPFECNICGRAFRQPGNLTRHKLTHTTIKPYSCNKCGKSFNRVSNLHAHIKIHSDGKPYVCIVCGCSFYQKVDLKLHALSHSNDKIHECSFCKRTFKQAAHLKYHLHSHLKQFDKFENELKLNGGRDSNGNYYITSESDLKNFKRMVEMKKMEEDSSNPKKNSLTDEEQLEKNENSNNINQTEENEHHISESSNDCEDYEMGDEEDDEDDDDEEEEEYEENFNDVDDNDQLIGENEEFDIDQEHDSKNNELGSHTEDDNNDIKNAESKDDEGTTPE